MKVDSVSPSSSTLSTATKFGIDVPRGSVAGFMSANQALQLRCKNLEIEEGDNSRSRSRYRSIK
jgi:hypothetical protein